MKADDHTVLMTTNTAPKWPHAVALAKRIKDELQALGMTQGDLEEAAGLLSDGERNRFNRRTLQLWSKGTHQPSYEKTLVAFEAMGMSRAEAADIFQEICGRFGISFSTMSGVKSLNIADDSMLADIRRAVLADPDITHLPAVFESGARFPIATTYVDLAVDERPPYFRPQLLEVPTTPAQRMEERERLMRFPRRPAKTVLNVTHRRPAIVIAGPGMGKSALLRRIALDIAAGEWDVAQIPLFIEARRYWAARQEAPGLTLVEYALERWCPALKAQPKVRANLVSAVTAGAYSHVVLLIDGLDEIAGQAGAFDSISTALDGLSGKLRWIATARPTGLPRHCGGARRLELTPLAPDAVEQLITVWSKAADAPPDFAQTIYAEILASPSLSTMSGNPFLLTALCYLKLAALSRPLPQNRSGVYERLLSQVALQVQRRYGDSRILDSAAMKAIASFSLALYQSSQIPKQLFSQADWDLHAPRDIDFASKVLPARLIASLNEIDDEYHFVHLSLQEHLIARALLDAPRDVIWQRRFQPAWRPIFRAYGALLHQAGRLKSFEELVRKLFEERDIQDLSLCHLAEIFADAGIKDTRPWIGADLRPILLQSFDNGWNEVASQVASALQMLDPQYLEAHAMLRIETLDADFDYMQEQYPEDFETASFPGETYQQYGFDPLNALRLLASARTVGAYERVRGLFFGTDQRLALCAATAFADLARPSDRLKLADLAKKADPLGDWGCRLYAFSIAAPCAELVSFLIRLEKAKRRDRDRWWNDIWRILLDIGGKEVAAHLEALLQDDVAVWKKFPSKIRLSDDPPAPLQEAHRNVVIALSQLRGLDMTEQERLLSKSCRQLDAPWFQQMILSDQIKNGTVDEAVVRACFDDPDQRESTLAALEGSPARTGHALSLPLRAHLLSLAPRVDEEEFWMIAEIEARNLRLGVPPMDQDLFLEAAYDLWARIKADPSLGNLSMMVTHLDSLLAPARAARDARALDLVFESLTHPALYALAESEEELATALLGQMIGIAGDILNGNCVPRNDADTKRFSEVFRAIIFTDAIDLCQTALEALGKINLPALLDLRGASLFYPALEAVSSQMDIMVFGDFWVGADGKVYPYQDHRQIIYVTGQDDRGDTVGGALAHQFVSRGFAIASPYHEPEGVIVATVILSCDQEAPDAERAADTKEKLAKLRAMGGRIFEVDLDEAEANPAEISARIVTAIATS